MTEWDAPEYARVSELQKAMAEEVLALLDLKGTERVLDLDAVTGGSLQRSQLMSPWVLWWA